MNGDAGKLTGRLLVGYAIAGIVGMAALEMQNVWVLGIPLAELWPYNLLSVLSGVALIFLALAAVTRWMLRGWHRRERAGRPASEREAAALLSALHRLPWRLFRGLMALSVLFSLAYHYGYTLDADYPLASFTFDDYLELAGNLLNEQSIALLIGILIYVQSRRAVRPFVLRHPAAVPASGISSSFLAPIGITFASAVLLVVFNVLRMVIDQHLYGDPIRPGALFGSTAVYLAFGMLTVAGLAASLREEFRMLISGIRTLIEGNYGRPLPGKMPVLSNDAVGKLADTFNRLQDRVRREQDELERDRRLANDIRDKLRSPPTLAAGDYRMEVLPAEAPDEESMFHDVLLTPDGVLAALVGRLDERGMPGALLMSAALFLFRTEARGGRPAGQLLATLQAALQEAKWRESDRSLLVVTAHIGEHKAEMAGSGRFKTIRGVQAVSPGEAIVAGGHVRLERRKPG